MPKKEKKVTKTIYFHKGSYGYVDLNVNVWRNGTITLNPKSHFLLGLLIGEIAEIIDPCDLHEDVYELYAKETEFEKEQKNNPS